MLASSAKKGDELETYENLSQIGDLLSGETSADDVAQSKSHPDIFAAALPIFRDLADLLARYEESPLAEIRPKDHG